MSFDVVDIGPDPWPSLLLFATLWCLPTITFVIRRQLEPSVPLRRQLGFIQFILCLGAALYTYRWITAFEPSGELLRFGIICGASGLAISAIVLTVLRLAQRGGRSGVA